MKKSIEIDWQGNMAFNTNLDGHSFTIDAGLENNGEDKGPRPKKLMLVALAGCTGMDVVSILKKMKVQPEGLKIEVEGDLFEEHPHKFTSMHVIYKFKGKDLPEAKLKRAVELSQEKYCGVSATLAPAVELSYEIKMEE